MNQDPRKQPTKPIRKKPDYLIIIFALFITLGLFLFLQEVFKGNVEEMSYNEIKIAAEQGYIEEFSYISVGGDNLDLVEVTGTLRPNSDPEFVGITRFKGVIRHDQATEIILIVNVFGGTTNIETRSGITFWSVLLNILPIILILAVLFFIFRNANSANSKAFDFAKNRAKLNREKGVTFKDVAGCDEEKEELEEIIDFLKAPRKYLDMGARIPKGVLLVGAPGTGKTLLARAVAGEANVPFFSISGSDFVEMFVGVGASRVRDLFKVAKDNMPCIIFMDEIDAVGRQRGAGLGGGHDEREQTLNQLLVEMDGFSTNMGIIMIAATNRPDVLDPALLRPGRFDRQITIDLPDVRGREAILKVHARNKHLDPSIKLDKLAHRIPGFSGADIENLLNESALLAARDNRTMILESDLDEAMDRVRMGPAKKTRRITDSERQIVAYHESGHAVIGIKLEYANVVQKVTIIPRGRAGGYNLMVPSEERFLETRHTLIAMITSYLGGRVAEEIKFNSVTTGAYQDFQMATRIARAMVTEYGMSDLGPIQYETQNGNVFLGRDYLKEKNFSDQVAHEIDKEVRKIITECYDTAKEIITENMDLLDKIANYLLSVETLTKADIDEIVSTGKLAWADSKKENK
ncbi:MAG: ATP-dependent zinc metalloprotease FtsH [Acholeplasmataceae bacterium]